MFLRRVAGLTLVYLASMVLHSDLFAGPRGPAEDGAIASLAVYEAVQFKPLTLPPTQGKTLDLFVSDDLERTPRDYLRVTAAVKTSGIAQAALVLVDILDREYRSPVVKLPRGREYDLSINMKQVGHPISMLRAVRLYLKGEAVRVSKLRFFCANERLPKPDVVVKGPKDDTSIQAALDSLGDDGGVVYIPAGTYVLTRHVTIPSDNISIYGDGHATLIKRTRCDHRTIFLAKEKRNLRLTRLHLSGFPIDYFRGYVGQAAKMGRPEYAGKCPETGRGVYLIDCHNVRIDHCELELCGQSAVNTLRGSRHLVDHCFFHENYRGGLGYGVAIGGVTKDNYVEDNNFENHRHAVAGGGDRDTAYTIRFNRFVKDPKTVPATTDWNQLAQHDIDHHGDVNGRLGASFVYAHDNYLAMKHGKMHPRGAIAMRGSAKAWVYRNVIVNANRGIGGAPSKGDVHTLWVWDNKFINVDKKYSIAAWRDDGSIVRFGPKPADFAEIPYPHALNRLGWRPGASEPGGRTVNAKSQFAGPSKPQVLRLVSP